MACTTSLQSGQAIRAGHQGRPSGKAREGHQGRPSGKAIREGSQGRRSVAPAHRLHDEKVVALEREGVGSVKLDGKAGILRVAEQLAVEPHIEGRIDRIEAQEDALT